MTAGLGNMRVDRFGVVGQLLRFIWHLVGWAFRITLMLFLLQHSVIPFGEQWQSVSAMVRMEQFDYVGWEVRALGAKTLQTLYGVQPFMNEADRADYVRQYFADLAHARGLESQIERVYTDPLIEDAKAATIDLRSERDQLREDLASRQMLVESIIEGQVASVLIDEGFGTLGQLLPPISMHFTRVPNLLIVSPRDEIRFEVSINLNPMPIDEIAALEDRIDQAHDVSSLIVPLGGIALYPAMILETTSLTFAVETFAHEWLHHYLFFYPLGLNYEFAGETRVINETTANIFGRAIAPLVLRRYYPELAQVAAPTQTHRNIAQTHHETTQTHHETTQTRHDTIQLINFTQRQDVPFDFGAAMHETRTRVDELIAAGLVEEAEAYMEERRRLFVENGYGIRKLNQAYFAFYGGYQSGTPGAGGQDPTGAAVQAILDQSGGLHDWITIMRNITTRDELLQAVGMERG